MIKRFKLPRKIQLLVLLIVLLLGGAFLITRNSNVNLIKVSGSSSIDLPNDGVYTVGQEFVVPVNLDTGSNNVVATEVALDYPTNLLRLEQDQAGTDWEPEAYGDPLSGAPIQGKIARLVGSETPINGVTTLMTMKFTALAAGSGTISMNKIEAADQNIQLVSVSTSSVPFTITEGTTTGIINLVFTLQGRNQNDYAKSGINLKVWNPGNRTSGQEVLTKNDISADATGVTSFQLAGLSNGNYDFQIKVPGYLSQSLNNVAVDINLQLPLSFNGPNSNGLLAGDLLNDDAINGGDFTFLKQKFNTNDAIADINHDGTVNTLDYSFIYLNWGQPK